MTKITHERFALVKLMSRGGHFNLNASKEMNARLVILILCLQTFCIIDLFAKPETLMNADKPWQRA